MHIALYGTRYHLIIFNQIDILPSSIHSLQTRELWSKCVRCVLTKQTCVILSLVLGAPKNAGTSPDFQGKLCFIYFFSFSLLSKIHLLARKSQCVCSVGTFVFVRNPIVCDEMVAFKSWIWLKQHPTSIMNSNIESGSAKCLLERNHVVCTSSMSVVGLCTLRDFLYERSHKQRNLAIEHVPIIN